MRQLREQRQWEWKRQLREQRQWQRKRQLREQRQWQRKRTVLGGAGVGFQGDFQPRRKARSEEHTSELQSLMRISYAVFCLKKKKHINENPSNRKDIKFI